MNTLHITITSADNGHLTGTTSNGQAAEFFRCTGTWFIGETQVYPWQTQIIVKWAIAE
jgi:hypothetical protein